MAVTEQTAQAKRISFELPSGQAVLLKPLKREDYEELNKWVRKQYLENVREACIGLNPAEKQDLLEAALSHAAKLSFQHGDGREILLESAYGLARLVYQMIYKPEMSFDRFNSVLFPDGFMTVEGMDTLSAMLETGYGVLPKDEAKVESAKAAGAVIEPKEADSESVAEAEIAQKAE